MRGVLAFSVSVSPLSVKQVEVKTLLSAFPAFDSTTISRCLYSFLLLRAWLLPALPLQGFSLERTVPTIQTTRSSVMSLSREASTTCLTRGLIRHAELSSLKVLKTQLRE